MPLVQLTLGTVRQLVANRGFSRWPDIAELLANTLDLPDSAIVQFSETEPAGILVDDEGAMIQFNIDQPLRTQQIPPAST